MKKIILIALVALSTSQSAFALLSPLNQSIKEIMTLLSDPKIKSLGQNSIIEDIEQTEIGYVIKTKDQQMLVEIIYTPRAGAAPKKFEFVYHDPVSITDTIGIEK